MKRKHRLFAALTTLLLGLMLCAVNVSALGMEDSAVYIRSGSKKTFTLPTNRDKIYYTFTLTKDDEISFTVRAECECIWTYLLDSNGQEVSHWLDWEGSSGLSIREEKRTLSR